MASTKPVNRRVASRRGFLRACTLASGGLIPLVTGGPRWVPAALAAPITLLPTDTKATTQAKLDAAPSGATVLVAAGTYDWSNDFLPTTVLISKSLKLRPADNLNPPLFLGNPDIERQDNHCFRFLGSGVRVEVEGLRFQSFRVALNAGSAAPESVASYAAIDVRGCEFMGTRTGFAVGSRDTGRDVSLDGNRFIDCRNDILLLGSPLKRVVIADNQFTGCRNGIFGDNTGAVADGSPLLDSRIARNEFTSCRTGIVLDAPLTEVDIADNDFEDTRAISIVGPIDGLRIAGNRIAAGHGASILVGSPFSYATGVQVSDNEMVYGGPSVDFPIGDGVVLVSCTDALVAGNRIDGFDSILPGAVGVGIVNAFLLGGTAVGAHVVDNDVRGCALGLLLVTRQVPNAPAAIVTGGLANRNVFTDNEVGVLAHHSANGYVIRGNTYSVNRLYDLALLGDPPVPAGFVFDPRQPPVFANEPSGGLGPSFSITVKESIGLNYIDFGANNTVELT